MVDLKDYKIFIQRIGLVGITNLIVALITLLLLPILTQNLSIEEYGIWVQITVTSSLISTFANLGLPYTMVRYLSSENDKKIIRDVFYSIMLIIVIINLLITSIFFLLSQPLSTLLFGGDVAVTRITSFIIFFTCMNFFLFTYFRTFQQMKRYSILLLFQNFLNLALAAYITLSGFGIFELTIGILITQIISFALIFLIILLDIGFEIPKFNKIREYLSFGIPTLPGNLSNWIVDSSDRYIISIILGVTFVGYYNPGYTLASVITMLLAPLTFLLPAVLPKYYDNNQMDDVKRILTYSLKYFLLLAIPIGFGLSILSKQVLHIITTPQIALSGYMVTPFICASYILFGIYGILVNIIILNYKTKIIGQIWILCSIVNIVFNIFLISYIGILGSAIATLIAYFIAFILILKYSSKYIDINLDIIFIAKSIISSIIMSLIIVLLNPQGILNLLVSIGMGGIIYFIILFLLKGIKIEEIKFFKRILS